MTRHIPVSVSYEASLYASPGQCALCSNSHIYQYKSMQNQRLKVSDNGDV